MQSQLAVCQKYGVPFFPSPSNLKVGIAENVRKGLKPINGVRVAPTEETTGWFLWAGETMWKDDDFFLPMHVAHVIDWCPQAIKFLGLPPGSRFLVDGDFEDVWMDLSVRDEVAPVRPQAKMNLAPDPPREE